MPTQRLSIREAAEHLGLSDATIRRRLKDGQLRGEQEETAQGFRWYVLIDREEEAPDQSSHQVPIQEVILPTQTPTQDDQARVEDLKSEIGYLRETLTTTLRQLDDARTQATAERERADILQREALQRIESLTAGPIDREQGAHEATGSPRSVVAPEDDSGHGDDAQERRGTLWQRLGRWIRGEM